MASDKILPPVNQRIRQVRNTLNLSQVQFAQVICVSKGYLADIEIGVRKANDRIIKLVCSCFNVGEQWLKDGGGEMFTKNPAEGFTKLVSLYGRLDPKYQEYILKQIDLLLNIQAQDKKA